LKKDSYCNRQERQGCQENFGKLKTKSIAVSGIKLVKVLQKPFCGQIADLVSKLSKEKRHSFKTTSIGAIKPPVR